MRRYNECQAVEMTLRNQLVEAIDDDVLQPLRNTATDMINSLIPDIITFLVDTYGKLSPSQLRERERVIDDMTYDPAQNIDTVFNKTQNFQELCILLNNEKTDKQLITYAYLCFQKIGLFQNSFIKWNTKPSANHTFNNFKIFMRQQYLELDAVGGLTVGTSSLNLMK